MLSAYYCMLFSSGVGIRVRIRFSVWLVSGYTDAFILPSVVIVPYPVFAWRRGWVINPMDVTYWWLIPAAVVPAMLGMILIFLDQQITSVIVNRKEHKLKVTLYRRFVSMSVATNYCIFFLRRRLYGHFWPKKTNVDGQYLGLLLGRCGRLHNRRTMPGLAIVVARKKRQTLSHWWILRGFFLECGWANLCKG